MKPQPVSFLEAKKQKTFRHFWPVSRETGHKKKVRFLPKTIWNSKNGQSFTETGHKKKGFFAINFAKRPISSETGWN